MENTHVQLQQHISDTTEHKIDNNEPVTNENNYPPHLKWLFGVLYVSQLLPSTECGNIASRIIWGIFYFCYVALQIFALYTYGDADKIGSDSCTDDEALVGFVIVIATISLNAGIHIQLWISLWKNKKFQTIAFNTDITQHILTDELKQSYDTKCKSKFWLNGVMTGIIVPVLIFNVTTLWPFSGHDILSVYVSWIILIVYCIIFMVVSIPQNSVVSAFWYFTDILKKYIEYKQLLIENLEVDENKNMSEIIVKEYKKVRKYLEIAADNFNMINIYVVLSHVVSVLFDVIYFLQCTNQQNYILMILLVGCSMGFIVPLWYMADVTEKAKDFEKIVLFRLDEFGSIHAGFTTYVLSRPIGYTFGTKDTIMTKNTLFGILNVTGTVLIALYRGILTAK
eukprot:324821_1